MWTCKQCGEQIEDQFDSCWKCAAKTAPGAESTSGQAKRPLSVTELFPILVMAFLAPLIAVTLHSSIVWLRGIRFYQAELGSISSPRFWIALGVMGAITLAVLWRFARDTFWCRAIWLGSVLIWLLLLVKAETVYK